MAQNCLFCKMISGDIPADIVYEDDLALAFRDIKPQAPEHVLVIPKKHIAHLTELTDEDNELVGHLFQVVNKVAKELDIFESGWRSIINTLNNGGQTVYHIHIHVLGGRFMTWPPG